MSDCLGFNPFQPFCFAYDSLTFQTSRREPRADNLLREFMENRYLGIDFSGNAKMWTLGCSTSNVWIADIRRHSDSFVLTELCRVQQLTDGNSPFQRLTQFLSRRDFRVAAITSRATWMIEAGANPKDVQGQMRHSRISTTMDIYAQFVPESARRAMEKTREMVERRQQAMQQLATQAVQ